MTPARLERLLQCLGKLDPENRLMEANEWLGADEEPFTVGEIREFLAQRLPHTPLTMPPYDTVERWSDALADCGCWFRGFYAARPEEGEMPPAWRVLSEINLAMKGHLDAWSAAEKTHRHRE